LRTHLGPASSGLSSAKSVGQVGAAPTMQPPLTPSQLTFPQAHLSTAPPLFSPKLHAVSNLFFLTTLKNGTFLKSGSCCLTSQLSLIKVTRCTAPRCSQGHSSHALFNTSLRVLVGNQLHHS